MPSSDGTDSNATIGANRGGGSSSRGSHERTHAESGERTQHSGAPIAHSPIRRNDESDAPPAYPFTAGTGEPALAALGRTVDEPDGPGERRSRAFPEDPDFAALPAPPEPKHALKVVDGAGDDAAEPSGASINPTTAATMGDFAAAMAGPIAAAAFAGSLAVFIGSALFVLLVRAQGRRSALSDTEVGAVSPFAAALSAALLCYAVVPDAGTIHALSAGLIALGAGVAAAFILRMIVERYVHTRIAVLGDAATAHELAWKLSSSANRRFTVVGYVTRTSERDNLRDLAHVSFKVRRLGLLTDLSQIVARNDIDLLVMGPVDDRLKVFERAATCTERFRTRLLSLAAFEENVFRRVPLDHINVAWFQHIMHPRFKPVPHAVTRAVDVIFAAVFGLLTLPLWAPTTLFMRLAFGRPVLVERRRVGERGRAVHLLHFRVARREITGEPPAEAKPAVGFGRFLRATGIEQLPLLLNLARGDITLVGPRAQHPDRLAELERELPFYARRNLLRPGLTGWAQLHGSRGAREELSHDFFYLKHQSLMLYAYVLLATLWRGPRHSARATTSN